MHTSNSDFVPALGAVGTSNSDLEPVCPGLPGPGASSDFENLSGTSGVVNNGFDCDPKSPQHIPIDINILSSSDYQQQGNELRQAGPRRATALNCEGMVGSHELEQQQLNNNNDNRQQQQHQMELRQAGPRRTMALTCEGMVGSPSQQHNNNNEQTVVGDTLWQRHHDSHSSLRVAGGIRSRSPQKSAIYSKDSSIAWSAEHLSSTTLDEDSETMQNDTQHKDNNTQQQQQQQCSPQQQQQKDCPHLCKECNLHILDCSCEHKHESSSCSQDDQQESLCLNCNLSIIDCSCSQVSPECMPCTVTHNAPDITCNHGHNCNSVLSSVSSGGSHLQNSRNMVCVRSSHSDQAGTSLHVDRQTLTWCMCEHNLSLCPHGESLMECLECICEHQCPFKYCMTKGCWHRATEADLLCCHEVYLYDCTLGCTASEYAPARDPSYIVTCPHDLEYPLCSVCWCTKHQCIQQLQSCRECEHENNNRHNNNNNNNNNDNHFGTPKGAHLQTGYHPL